MRRMVASMSLEISGRPRGLRLWRYDLKQIECMVNAESRRFQHGFPEVCQDFLIRDCESPTQGKGGRPYNSRQRVRRGDVIIQLDSMGRAQRASICTPEPTRESNTQARA